MPGLPLEPSDEDSRMNLGQPAEIGLVDPLLVGHTVYRALTDGKIASASKLNPQSLPDPPAIFLSWGLSADSGWVQ